MVIGVGLFSELLKKGPVQEPLIAVAVGVLVGPRGLALLDVRGWGDQHIILEEASRLTLAIGLMGVALRLKRDQVRTLVWPVALLLTFGMLVMWAVSSVLGAWVLGLPLLYALLFGAAITPTDPIVASAIVTGRFAQETLPDRLRGTLSFESGANDGLGYLLIFLPILLVTMAPGEAWGRWLTHTLLVGVVLASLLGLAIGYAAGRLLNWSKRKGWIENYSYLSFTVALSLFTLGAASLAGAEALISIFVSGLVFDFVAETEEKHEEENIQETVTRLFSLPMFVLFGLALPWEAWAGHGWAFSLLAVLVLLLRRPMTLAVLWPLLRGRLTGPDLAYLGWFGPVGIAAVFYAVLAVRHTGAETVWHAASAVILGSVLAHGLTATAFTRLYARHAQTLR